MVDSEPRETGRDQKGTRSVRGVVPWIISAVALVVAAVAIGMLVFGDRGGPQPVARLTPQSGSAADEPDPTVEDETAQAWGLGDPDFTSYGGYGELGIFSTTNSDGLQCVVIELEGRAVMVRCTAPTLATVADVSFPSDMFPPMASGEPIPELSTVRFILQDETIDVFLGPWPEDEP